MWAPGVTVVLAYVHMTNKGEIQSLISEDNFKTWYIVYPISMDISVQIVLQNV